MLNLALQVIDFGALGSDHAWEHHLIAVGSLGVEQQMFLDLGKRPFPHLQIDVIATTMQKMSLSTISPVLKKKSSLTLTRYSYAESAAEPRVNV
jgi:hypothetical protein